LGLGCNCALLVLFSFPLFIGEDILFWNDDSPSYAPPVFPEFATVYEAFDCRPVNTEIFGDGVNREIADRDFLIRWTGVLSWHGFLRLNLKGVGTSEAGELLVKRTYAFVMPSVRGVWNRFNGRFAELSYSR
jgi:hypothetical protein